MVSEGIITLRDIEDAKSNKDSAGVISIGLPAYCIYQSLLRSAKANCAGILLSEYKFSVPFSRFQDFSFRSI